MTARYFNIGIACVLLICLDAFLTIYYTHEGIVKEANPLLTTPARYLGLELVLAIRTWLALWGIVYLVVKAEEHFYISPVPKATRIARAGLYAIFGVYLLVNIYHVLGRILWL